MRNPTTVGRSFAIALACLACTGLRTGAAAPSQLQQLEQTTQQIRQLSPLKPVAASFLNDTKFNAVVQANLRKGETDANLEISRRELVLLGMLGPTVDYRKLVYDNLTSQVLGLYDYDAKKLYVRSESGKVFGVDRYAIAHEYTHALQDQHYHLRKLMPDESAIAYRNSDAESAHHALVEGDAVNTQLLYISRAYTATEIHTLVTEPVPAVKPLPIAMQREFDFPYTSGLQFVQKLYKSGGMFAVNAAYAHLPRSTFEIMHPSYYVQHWHPTSVTLHAVVGLSGWKQVDDDVNGAFGTKLILWQYVTQAQADSATNSYRGDRYVFLENGSQDAMLLKTLWESPTAAKLALSVWLRSLHLRFPHAHATTTGGTTLVAAAGVSVYLHVSKSALKVVYAPTTAFARQLGTSVTT